MRKFTFNVVVIVIFHVMIVFAESFIQSKLILWDESYIYLLIIMTITLVVLFLLDNRIIKKK